MKKIISVIALCVLFLCGCNSVNEKSVLMEEPMTIAAETYTVAEEKSEEILNQQEENVEEQTEKQSVPVKEQEDPLVNEETQEEIETSEQFYEEIIYEEVNVPEIVDTVSLLVDCSDILNDINSLKEEKRSYVPDDGVIFFLENIEFAEGDSVFDILKRELSSRGIHLEFNLSPVVNNAYIEGIGNIYEFDCGERSGWKYSVNGKFPPVGCSDYKVKPGDKIEFIYKIKAY